MVKEILGAYSFVAHFGRAVAEGSWNLKNTRKFWLTVLDAKCYPEIEFFQNFRLPPPPLMTNDELRGPSVWGSENRVFVPFGKLKLKR